MNWKPITSSVPPRSPAFLAELAANATHLPASVVMKSVTEYMLQSYTEMFHNLRSEIVDEVNPDLIVCNTFAFACSDVAIATGRPFVIVFPSTMDMKLSLFQPQALLDRLRTKLGYVHSVWDALPSVWYFYSTRRAAQREVSLMQHFRAVRAAPHIVNSVIGLEDMPRGEPHIQYVGPVVSRKQPALDSNAALAAFMAECERAGDAVVFIAMGSVARLADPRPLRDGLRLAAKRSRVPFRVVLVDGRSAATAEEAGEEGPAGLVHRVRWAPQQAVLGHSATRLFVSHGGLNSMTEAVVNAVPVLCLPLYTDQPGNCALLEARGAGCVIILVVIFMS